jgi:hypothetical protein
MRYFLLCVFLALSAWNEGMGQAVSPAGDLLAAGSVWTGSRRFEKASGDLKKKGQPLKLVVTERNGEAFKGKLTLGKTLAGPDLTVDVTGKGPAKGGGPVNFKSNSLGELNQTFQGKIESGVMALEFKGLITGALPVEGVAALQRKGDGPAR